VTLARALADAHRTGIPGAYGVGREQPRWRELDLAKLRCRVWLDDDMVHDAAGAHPQGYPLAQLRAQWRVPPAILGGFRAGQIVTTGALCGIVGIEGVSSVRAEFEEFGSVSVTIARWA
jgi:2-keto-4-pentenoate hydratase